MALSWFFFLVLLLEMAVFSTTLLHGQQQPSTDGFISIDCGITSNTTYTDTTTGITYVSDDQFTDAGINYNISSTYSSSSLHKQLFTLRSFPSLSRSCYVLKPATQYNKYILRATLLYGNYDGKNSGNPVKPLQFDLYVDVNPWHTVIIRDPNSTYWYEAVVAALGDSISVCLVNTGSGTPFVSSLELRPIEGVMYPAVNATLYLVTGIRVNVGPPTTNAIVRYPDDPYDRIWNPWTYPNQWTEISTNETMHINSNAIFQPPIVVMQTAATPINSSLMEFSWDSSAIGAPVNEEYVNLYFSEFLPNSSRAFTVYFNGDTWYSNYTPPYLKRGAIYSTAPVTPSQRYNWALNSSGLSTLPPILNAMEAFTAMPLTQAPTKSGDVDAINAIKEQYQVKRSWMADPCAPKQYPWDGLNCSYGTNSPRITAVNLSSSALAGVISSSFAKLTEIKYLDLSYNNLTGSIPDALGTLSWLQVLNLTGNNLTGTIPDSLLKRSQGALTFRYDDNPYLCPGGTSGEPKPKKIGTAVIVILCVVPVVLVLLLVFIFIVWRVRKSRGSTPGTYHRPAIDNFPNPLKRPRDNLSQLENRQFTYKELEKITNKFTHALGKGGFGTVFLGYLGDGTQVAVKVRSQSSSQGTKEFLAEAQNLTKIHHKNLVSLVGYCMDGDHLALVYEFMSQGTLQDHLRGKTCSAAAWSWRQRLQIAVEAAQGLEYLHKGCKPPLIHRDVKSANILLSESLEAKIADFGLSRAFDDGNHSHVSTAAVGTPGYLDPEYYFSYQHSEKNDVYSFGVVLLELITGRPPIVVTGNQSASLVEWMRQKLASGNIKDVVDAKLQKVYDVNSMWKAADVALRCTAQAPQKKPTMTAVVMELRECVELERSVYYRSEFPSASNKNICTETTTESSQTNATSETSAFEVEQFPEFSPSAR